MKEKKDKPAHVWVKNKYSADRQSERENLCTYEAEEKKVFRILKILLLVAVGVQTLLSILSLYFNNGFDIKYYMFYFEGNILNYGLLIMVFSYVLFSLKDGKSRNNFKRIFRKYLSAENLLLTSFLVWMFVSGCHYFFDNQNIFKENSILYNNAVLKFLLFFLLGQYLNGARKWLHFFLNGLVFILTLFSIYVLVMLVFHSDFTFRNGGTVFFSGGEVKRLGINSNPNTTALYAKTMFMLCVYLFVAVKGKIRWLYPAAAAVHYMILILTCSRAAILSGAAGVSAVVMLAVWRGFRGRKLPSRMLISLGTFAAAFFLFLMIRVPAVGAYNFFREIYAGQEKLVVREMSLQSSGRLVLYKAALQSMRNPEIALFGVTPDGICDLLNEVTGLELNMYTHNEFLEVMCATGIPGLLLFLSWVVCIARKGWIVCYDRDNFFPMRDGALAIVFFTELLNNMLEAYLTFHSIFMSGMIFYISAGYILTDERKRHEIIET